MNAWMLYLLAGTATLAGVLIDLWRSAVRRS